MVRVLGLLNSTSFSRLPDFFFLGPRLRLGNLMTGLVFMLSGGSKYALVTRSTYPTEYTHVGITR